MKKNIVCMFKHKKPQIEKFEAFCVMILTAIYFKIGL